MPIPQGTNLLFGKVFAENYMKIKKRWTGVRGISIPPDLPLLYAWVMHHSSKIMSKAFDLPKKSLFPKFAPLLFQNKPNSECNR